MMAKRILYEKVELDDSLPIKLTHFYSNYVTKGFSYHWHNSIEIILPVIGGANIWIEGEVFDNYGGEISIINSQYIHKSRMLDGTSEYMGFALQINYNFLKKCFSEIDNYYFKQPNKKTERKLIKIIYDIINEYSSQKDYKNVKIYSLIYELIYIMIDKLLVKREGTVKIRNSKDNQKILNITNFIDKHYNDNISITQIAEHFKWSYGYLSKYFKEHVGITIKEYTDNVRITHAKRDLIFTDQTITDIAYLHGFSNLQSFTTVFKKKYNMNPSEYKKKMRNSC